MHASSPGPHAAGAQAPRPLRLPTWLAAPPGAGAIATIVAGLLALVAVTNRWMGFHAGLRYAHGDDEHAYLTIAGAFPGLPDERIADQHAQRWPVHWLVGGLSDLVAASPEAVYRWAAIALAIGVLVTAGEVLRRVGASTATTAIALAAVALNPYALRYYGLAPGYLADLAFDLALALLLLGMVVRRLPLVLAALVLGTLARQTMAPVVPVVAAWVALGAGWRDAPGPAATLRGRRVALVPVLATVLVPLAAYLAVHAAAAGFSRAGVPFARLTILQALGDLPGSAGDLLNHAAHTVNALLAVGALLLATAIAARGRRLPELAWGGLAVGAMIVLQAAALNPDPVFDDWSSTNEPRLVAMGLVPLAVAFGAARTALEGQGARPLAGARAAVAAILALLALGSLHHIYTSVSTGSKEATLAVELLTAAAVLALLLRLDERRSRRAGDGLPATPRPVG